MRHSPPTNVPHPLQSSPPKENSLTVQAFKMSLQSKQPWWMLHFKTEDGERLGWWMSGWGTSYNRAQPGGLMRRRPSDPSWPGFPLLLILAGEISYIFWNSMLNMKLKLFCHLMNVYDFLTQNLPGGIRRSREVLEPEERSLVLQVLLNLFRNVISSYSYSCR